MDRDRKSFNVTAEWDAEASVWVATSEDVPGLVTEAPTVEELLAKLQVMIPELLEANGVKPDHDGWHGVPLSLVAHREQVINVD